VGALLRAPLPDAGPFGEAWVLSDRDDHNSKVANGAWAGQTLRQLLERCPEEMLGELSGNSRRFPLLLKFLDCKKMLSVQVHPSDANGPRGESGKTEGWVVLEAGPESRVSAGLKPGVDRKALMDALAAEEPERVLRSFTPVRGVSFFIPAGRVHSLGGDVTVFEIQQNSDVTYRLSDWGHVDEQTGQPRPLQADQALACVDFGDSVSALCAPTNEDREKVFDCEPFRLWRRKGESPFALGATASPTVLVGQKGSGTLEHGDEAYALTGGDVLILPAVVGSCRFRPLGSASVLEIALPGDKR
jgi:mannose-6-phosphate isomerase